MVLRDAYLQKLGPDMDRQRHIMAGAAYQAGDPEAVAARYRLHFKPALKRSQDYEKLMARMKAAFISQGSEGIVKARAVGDHDFIPGAISRHLAGAIPASRLVTLRNRGHFAYLECPGDVRAAVDDFFRRPRACQRAQ